MEDGFRIFNSQTYLRCEAPTQASTSEARPPRAQPLAAACCYCVACAPAPRK